MNRMDITYYIFCGACVYLISKNQWSDVHVGKKIINRLNMLLSFRTMFAIVASRKMFNILSCKSQRKCMLYQAMQRPEYYVISMLLQAELNLFKSQHQGVTVPPDKLKVNNMSCKPINQTSLIKPCKFMLFSQHPKQKIKSKTFKYLNKVQCKAYGDFGHM